MSNSENIGLGLNFDPKLNQIFRQAQSRRRTILKHIFQKTNSKEGLLQFLNFNI